MEYISGISGRRRHLPLWHRFCWTGRKMLPGRIMVLLVCSGAVLSFLGAYDPFAEFAGAGASVPLLGFGNLLFTGVKGSAAGKRRIGIVLPGGSAPAPRPVGGSDFWVSGRLIFKPKLKK